MAEFTSLLTIFVWAYPVPRYAESQTDLISVNELVLYLQNATIEYSSEALCASVCVCVCVCVCMYVSVCVCVCFCTITQKEIDLGI